MVLLSDKLTVWTIGFRWCGLDPDGVWLRIPLAVRDNFRNLIDAIRKADLYCESIVMEKPRPPDLPREFTVYGYMDDMDSCIAGFHYNRKMLRWALVERYDFKLWCERRAIPLPEFWFPPGWNLEYELPEDEIHPGYVRLRRYHAPDIADEESEEALTAEEVESAPLQSDPVGEPSALATAGAITKDVALQKSPEVSATVAAKEEEARKKLRANQSARIACKQIASVIWKEDPTRTIASVVRDKLIQHYGGGGHYEEATVREWIKVVAPPEVSAKRGRPLKKNGAPDD